jgi:hypothetical protein
MNSSDLVLSPVNICGGLLTSLSVPCIRIGAGERGGAPLPGGPPRPVVLLLLVVPILGSLLLEIPLWVDPLLVC